MNAVKIKAVSFEVYVIIIVYPPTTRIVSGFNIIFEHTFLFYLCCKGNDEKVHTDNEIKIYKFCNTITCCNIFNKERSNIIFYIFS